METLNINRREVSKTNRNNRIDSNLFSIGSTSALQTSGKNYQFKNGIGVNGSVVSLSGKYSGTTELNGYVRNSNNQLIPNLTALSVSGNTKIYGALTDLDLNGKFISGSTALTVSGNTKIYGNLNVEGNITASKEVIAYFTSAATENILNDLSFTYPLFNSGSTISLKYNSNQFKIENNELALKNIALTGVSWNIITNKPTTFTPAAHNQDWSTITNKPTFFTGNGSYQDLLNIPLTFAPAAHNQDWSTITSKPTFFSGSYTDLTSKPTLFSGSYADLTSKPTLFSGSYTDLTNKPTLFNGSYSGLTGIPSTFTPAAHNQDWSTITSKPSFATVATSGSYTDLTNKPTLFAGYYQDLLNIPLTFAPAAHNQDWSTITSKPSFATVATSGSYTDLTNKPTLFSGSYTDLTSKPTLFSGSYTDLTNKPTLFAGYYSDLLNIPLTFTPAAHNQDWSTITSKPTLFSGSYTDLTSKPTLFNGSYSGLTGIPSTFTPAAHNQDWSTITSKPSFATVATSGSYTDLTNKPTLFSGSYTDLTNKPTLFAGYYSDLLNIPLTFAPAAHNQDWSTITSKPTLFSGSYTDLTNKPTLFNGSYSGLTGIPSTFTPAAHNQDWSTITSKPTFATVATSGSYTDLTNKPINGTQNKIVKFGTSTSITDSSISDTGSLIETSVDFNVKANSGAQKFKIKDSSDSTIWSIGINGNDLYFYNASNQLKAKIDQSGNLTASGDVIAYG